VAVIINPPIPFQNKKIKKNVLPPRILITLVALMMLGLTGRLKKVVTVIVSPILLMKDAKNITDNSTNIMNVLQEIISKIDPFFTDSATEDLYNIICKSRRE
jgi:hypothetical protein